MSKESLQAFLQKASSDKNLMEEVESAFSEKKGEEAIEALVLLGSEQGYEFNAEEAVAFFSVKSGELSDSELEGVAGGSSFLEFVSRLVRNIGPVFG